MNKINFFFDKQFSVVSGLWGEASLLGPCGLRSQ